MLSKSTIPFCVFDAPIEELRLSTDFFADLVDLMADESVHIRSHQALAQNLFNGAYSREHVTRWVNKSRYGEHWLTPNLSYTIIGTLLLRPRYRLPDTAIRHCGFKTTFYPDHIREDILELLWRYGVKCARGQCCGIVRMPTREAASA